MASPTSSPMAYARRPPALSRPRASVRTRASSSSSSSSVTVSEKYTSFSGHKIRYVDAKSNDTKAPVAVLVHGFGGNCEHWRKNVSAIAEAGVHTVAVDLLGYGKSEKPCPRTSSTPSSSNTSASSSSSSSTSNPPNTVYNMEVWADQVLSLVEEVAPHDADVFLVCNSIGGIVGLQAAIADAAKGESRVKGIVLLNVSLRMLHEKKQAPWLRPLVSSLQGLLRETPLGALFFKTVATREGVKNILGEAYGRKDAVTDELVDAILKPGLEPAALPVFLDFISYSGGPLPEDLLKEVQCPVHIIWGESDPWEPLKLARQEFASLPSVKDFTVLEGVGHCPQDEAPELVNPYVIDFIKKFS